MKALRLLTIAVFLAATVPRLAHRGMFVDGVTYASIARNLAEGRGRFWVPFYTETIYPAFYDHPPLGFWLQSLWFRVLGDHAFVERAYTFATGVLTALLIVWIWTAGRRLDRGPRPARDDAWLPVLLWIALPLVSWTLVGNLLENTLAVWSTAAVGAALAGGRARGARAAAWWGVASGLAVAGAVLTKGPVGLFPLAVPFVVAVVPRGPGSSVDSSGSGRRPWTMAAAQWGTVALTAAALSAWEPSRASLSRYVDQQVIAAVAGRREVSGSSWTIVLELVQGVWLPLAAAGALAAALARRFVPADPPQRRQALVFLLIGLSGSLPLLVSPKQAGHYVVPAVPFFALAAATLMAPTVAVLAGLPNVQRGSRLAAGLVLAGAAAVSLIPALGRDADRIADLDALAGSVPRGAVLGICPEANGDWGLHAYFARRFEASLDAEGSDRREWFLGTSPACRPSACEARTAPDRPLVLMRCRRGG